MKPVFMIFMLFLILSFLAGIYFCMNSHNLYQPFEGMENSVANGSNRESSVRENRDNTGSGCPNLLVRSGNSILLYNTNRPNDETNPIPFSNLDEYANYLAIQRQKEVHCPVLFLQQETNTQGDDVYRMRPDIFNPQPGLLQNMPTPSNQPPKVVPVIDASRESRVYNKNNYAGFDPYGLQIGEYSVLDKIHDSAIEMPLSDNPMDPNWGGVVYTQQQVDSGKYSENEVIAPTYTKTANTFAVPHLYQSDGPGRTPPNYILPNKTQSRDRWSDDSERLGGTYDVNLLATVNSGMAYNDRIDTQPDNNKNTVANTGYNPNIPGMKYLEPTPVSYQTNLNNWNKYNGGTGNVEYNPYITGASTSGWTKRSSGTSSSGSSSGTSSSGSSSSTSSSGSSSSTSTDLSNITFPQINTAIMGVLTGPQTKFYNAILNATLLVMDDVHQKAAVDVLKIMNFPQSLKPTIATAVQTSVQNLLNLCSDIKASNKDPSIYPKIETAVQPLKTLLEDQTGKLNKSQIIQLQKIDNDLQTAGMQNILQTLSKIMDTIFLQCSTN